LRIALSAVRDPEIQVLSIGELGILRSVDIASDGIPVIAITPTYLGCPAMDVIRADIREVVLAAGYGSVRIETVYSPAWHTGLIGPQARAKLKAAGIAPPVNSSISPDGRRLLGQSTVPPRCPRCDAECTEEISRFGSTACKALWRCQSCREPFEHLREL
jgi:ring-1,2-phenylacetyl-CoA epoxidase subunit PaaD